MQVDSTLSEVFREACKEYGLKEFHPEGIASIKPFVFALHLHREIELNFVAALDRDSLVSQVFALFKGIEESPFVKGLEAKFNKTLKDRDAEIEYLKEEVRSLQPYKTYYNLAKEMQHGVI